MTTELLIAPPAAGKTSACIQQIQTLRTKQPLAKIWVLVPDRLQAAAFRRRLGDAGGAMGTFIGTFGDLYRSILEQSGIFIPLTSAPMLHRLIQDIVDRAVEAGELQHFAPLQKMPGFISALRDSFAELERSLTQPSDFSEISWSAPPAQKDLAHLYSRFQGRLQELNLADPESISFRAISALNQHPLVVASIQLLIIDGFDSFTGAQYKVLKVLAQQVGSLFITFPGEADSSRPAHRRFTASIERLIRELSPTLASLDAKPYLPPEIQHIESQLFETKSSIVHPVKGPILLEARSPADEAREALRWIKKLVLRANIPLASCAVFSPNPALYHPFLRASADEYGIPIHFTQDEPLDQSPAVTALVNLLALPARNFNTRDLIQVLRCPYFEHAVHAESVDQLEQVSRVAQIVEGRDQWQEIWQRLETSHALKQSDVDDERILPGLPRGSQASELRLVLDGFFGKVTPPTNLNTHLQWIIWLEDLLERLQFYELAQSERDLAACEVFRETLRALVLSEAVIGERRVEYPVFLADLQGTLEGVGIRERASTDKPTLLIGRMTEARGARYQAVALLGFSEGIFPANEHPDPFLNENLRAALGIEQRLKREQAGLFYQAVTRSDRYLLITRPYLSDDGEKWEESTFWKAVQILFEPAAVQTIRPDDPQPLAEAASTQELLFSAVRRRGLPPAYSFLKERWDKLRHARDVLKARRSKQRAGPHEGFVGALAVSLNQRYSPDHIWSSSRLEKYSSCPYQFFIGTALGLEQPALPQLGLNASQLGLMLHKILEDTFKNAPHPINLDETLACLNKTCEQVFASAPNQFGFRPSPLWEYEQLQLQEKLEATVRALSADSDWEPMCFELNFGIDGAAPLEIDLGSETVQVRGVIDRVDRNSNGRLRVVDYKTGSGHLTAKDLKEGRRLQLPLYALAVRDACLLGTPIDGFYWKILNAEAGELKLASFKTNTFQGVQAAVEIVHEHLRHTLRGIRAAEFPPKSPQDGCSSYCPGSQWCWHYRPSGH